ncbi:MAG: polyprenyl synthetase family protein, partial [Chlamydiota bacterium]
MTTLGSESPTTLEIELLVKKTKATIEKRLIELVEPISPLSLQKSVRYALSSGKKLRPLLLLLTVETLHGDTQAALDTACALEMIHVYSLIHDDLPSMDNDDFRRGKPALHKQFPEWLALLTGDFFLTYAFEILSSTKNLSDSQKISLIQTLSTHSGSNGMIGGQCLDLEMKNQVCTSEKLQLMHEKKTGALFLAAVQCGALIANASEKEKEILNIFGKNFGSAYQMFDDIADISQNSSEANGA